MRILGVLTIGQSPRADGLTRDVQAIVGPGVRVVERGALDGLSRAEIDRLAPKPGDYHLITMLADGSSVQLGKAAILDRLQARIEQLEAEDEAGATLLMCTGAFPRFTHQRPLCQPQAALYGAVAGLAAGERIGALEPLVAQLDQGQAKWRALGHDDVILAAANPYVPEPLEAIRRSAAGVREAGAGILFMDCFGYSLEMAAAARAAFGGPVVLARSLAARLAAELIA
ncbi:MAG TPA: AroM family protein [Thermomicrobiaceae bacterium]|nr:AroM family protein [Thermomicrobiaceae bacterium]